MDDVRFMAFYEKAAFKIYGQRNCHYRICLAFCAGGNLYGLFKDQVPASLTNNDNSHFVKHVGSLN